MANTPLKNPYDPDGRSWKQLHKVSGQVSNADYHFFKQICPVEGSINAVVATLFKNLVDELRELDRQSKLDIAWHIDSPTYAVVLAILQRCSARGVVGQKGSRNVAKRTRRVHKDDGPVAK